MIACRDELWSDQKQNKPYVFGSVKMKFGELLLYNMWHVQHHSAQLNLILRQQINSAPRWVKRTNK